MKIVKKLSHVFVFGRGSQTHSRERAERRLCWWGQQRPHVRKGGWVERWEQNREEEEEMRREQSKGKRCMQRCLIHPFFPPFVPLCQVFFFHAAVSVFILSHSIITQSLFSKKCKQHWNIHILCSHSKIPEATICLCKCESDSRLQLSEVGSLSRKSQTWILTDCFRPQVRSWHRGRRHSWVQITQHMPWRLAGGGTEVFVTWNKWKRLCVCFLRCNQ